jgi:arylsulfatase A-like enzyme
MLRRLRAMICQFGVIFRPWICFIVYFWALEFQAVYGVGYETLIDGFTSTVPLLWTLIVWITLLAGCVSLVSLGWPMSGVRRINEALCRAGCLITTGYFFKRWLFQWQLTTLNADSNGWLLLVVIFPIYLAVRRHRKMHPTPMTDVIPSWEDTFSYVVVPLLITSVIAVAARVTDSLSANIHGGMARSVSAQANKPNVILIVADSLRAQSMSVYGHAEKTTPSIDRFAESSSVFLAMHANATTTIPSVLTLLTGRHALSHGRFNRELPARPQPLNLLYLLKHFGYSIGAVTSNGDAWGALQEMTWGLNLTEEMAFRLSLFSWLRRFGVYPTRVSGRMYGEIARMVPFLAYPRRTAVEGNIIDTTMDAEQLIAKLSPPFFLFVHIEEPHWPYQIAEDLKLSPVGADGSELAVSAPYSRVLQSVVDVYRGLYEMTIKKMDSELGKFLEETSRANNTLVILTADHGESFERGYFLHGEELYENSTWTPLLIRYPGQKEGERVKALTQSIDIAPTILDVLGIPKPVWMEGQPLKRGSKPAPVEIIAINYRYPYDGSFHSLPTKIAIWWDRYKLIATCKTGEASLYDLTRDQAEGVDIAAREPEVAEDLRRRLRARLTRQTAEPRLSCPSL